jgi:hypothetical protein
VSSDRRDREVSGASVALSSLSHELASPLTALYTYLKIAERAAPAGSLVKIRACADRLRAITAVARVASRPLEAGGEVDVAAAFAAADPAIAIEGSGRARIDHEALAAIASAVVFIAAPTRAHVDGTTIRVDRGAPPAHWRAIDAWSGERASFDLWALAMRCARVEVGDSEGTLAVTL